MRIVIAAEDDGTEYRRSFVVGGTQAGTQRLEPQWRPFAILVNDLPLETQKRMRVRFELIGPGEVWLDNVKLYDLLFPLKFYPNAQTEIKQFLILTKAAERAVEAGRVSDGVRLLEGYWPRFINAYTPPVKELVQANNRPPVNNQVKEATPPLAPQPDEDEEQAPSISERIKRFVPSLSR
jgi:hypothetical protein